MPLKQSVLVVGQADPVAIFRPGSCHRDDHEEEKENWFQVNQQKTLLLFKK